jgi:hypothetical protein
MLEGDAMKNNIVFCISAYYHNLLSTIYSFQLQKNNYKIYAIFFENNRYSFSNSGIWNKVYKLRRFNDRSLRKILFDKENMLEIVHKQLSDYKSVLENFSPKNTIIYNFTEYDLSNYLFMDIAYKMGFDIILNEEGIGTYVVQNFSKKALDSFIIEKFWKKNLKLEEMIVDSPWDAKFGIKSLDVFFRFPEYKILSYVLNTSNLTISRFQNKIYRVNLLNENSFKEIKNNLEKYIYWENISSKFNRKYECMIFLTHFKKKDTFYRLYEKVLRACNINNIRKVIIKTHPLNTSEELKLIENICFRLRINCDIITEKVSGEFLAFIYEPRFVISYYSSVSWFCQNIPNVHSLMVYNLEKSENTKYIKNSEKIIDFSKTNLIIPKSFDDLVHVLSHKNPESKNTDSLNKNWDFENIVEFLQNLRI